MLGAGEQARPPKRPVLLTEQTNRCRRGGFQNSDWQPRQSHLSDEGLSPLSYRGKNSVPPRALTEGRSAFRVLPCPHSPMRSGRIWGRTCPNNIHCLRRDHGPSLYDRAVPPSRNYNRALRRPPALSRGARCGPARPSRRDYVGPPPHPTLRSTRGPASRSAHQEATRSFSASSSMRNESWPCGAERTSRVARGRCPASSRCSGSG